MPLAALLVIALLAPSPLETRNGDAQLLLKSLNAERSAQGIGTLAIDATLSRVAWQQAEELAATGIVSHLSGDGSTPFERMRRANVRFGYAGENIALDRDVARADRALWNSAPHRHNTLEPHYQRIGIAAVATDRGEFFVEDFSD